MRVINGQIKMQTKMLIFFFAKIKYYFKKPYLTQAEETSFEKVIMVRD